MSTARITRVPYSPVLPKSTVPVQTRRDDTLLSAHRLNFSQSQWSPRGYPSNLKNVPIIRNSS